MNVGREHREHEPAAVRHLKYIVNLLDKATDFATIHGRSPDVPLCKWGYYDPADPNPISWSVPDETRPILLDDAQSDLWAEQLRATSLADDLSERFQLLEEIAQDVQRLLQWVQTLPPIDDPELRYIVQGLDTNLDFLKDNETALASTANADILNILDPGGTAEQQLEQVAEALGVAPHELAPYRWLDRHVMKSFSEGNPAVQRRIAHRVADRLRRHRLRREKNKGHDPTPTP